jgi:DNA-binding CsgD family transcriptional regulator
MSVVERDDELQQLLALLSRAREGHGALAVVHGPVGVGKTELLHAYAHRVINAGARTVSATASRTERGVLLGVVGQLFDALDLDGPQRFRVARLVEDGATVASLSRPGLDVDEARAPIFHTLLSVLAEALGGGGAAVITVDDIQFADDASLQFLLYLAHRIDALGAVLAVAVQTRGEPVQPLFISEFARRPHCREIHLHPLSRDGVSSLLTEHLDRHAASGRADGIHQVSGGNPLLTVALIEDQAAAGDSAGAVRVGESFRRAVLNILYRCDVDTLRVARALAVLDGPADAKVLGELAGLDARLAAEAVATLEAAGLLLDGRYRHAEAAAAVLSSLNADDAAGLHGQAADALHTHDVPDTQIARHLIRTRRTDLPWATAVLREAAACAGRDGRPDLAIAFLRQAERTARDGPERTAALAELMAAEWRVNPAAAYRRLGDVLAAAEAGALTDRHLGDAVHALLWFGRPAEAVELLDRVDSRAERSGPGTDTMRAWTGLLYPGSGDARVPPASAAADPSAAAVLVRALAAADPPREAVELAEQILQRSPLEDLQLSVVVAALSLLVKVGQLDQAAHWADALARGVSRRSLTWHALIGAIRAVVDVRKGNLLDAFQAAREALNRLPPRSWGVQIGLPIAAGVLAATGLARFDEADRLLRIPVPDAMFQTAIGLVYLHARGRYNNAVNRHYAALGDFQRCGELLAQWRLEEPSLVSWRTDAAQSCLALGMESEARRLLSEQLALVRARPSRERGATLRALASMAEMPKRARLLREAVDESEASGDQVELAHALADLGRVYQQQGDRQRARILVRRAYHIARRCGAETLCRDLSLNPADDHAGLDRNDPATEGAKQLSDAELRVALLAAQGRTNREIADQLYVSVSTVEQHLTKIYRKLRVTKRSDLPLVGL